LGIYEDAIVIDGLNVSNWDSPAVFQSLHAGRVTAINATVVAWENFAETMNHLARWPDRFETYSDVLIQVRSTADILRAKDEGRVGIILGFQNASPIENDLRNLSLFHDLGVKIIQVTYHERNLLGNGCWERRDEGLSNFGIDAVKEMNRLGILIDLSHVGDATSLESIDYSDKPVAITHSNARAFCDHPRNKPDDVLKLLKDKNGVIGSTSFPSFLPKKFESTINDYVDAIEDLIERVGVDHVGIGSDFTQDQPESFWRYIGSQQGTKWPSTFVKSTADYEKFADSPKGFETPDKLPNLAEVLTNRGYPPGDVGKILGGNWLRLFDEVWLGT
jgi:membrane dipeptidase